jgi:hypothetical protein
MGGIEGVRHVRVSRTIVPGPGTTKNLSSSDLLAKPLSHHGDTCFP